MKDEMRCDWVLRWDDEGAQCDLCVNDILVEKPLNGDNPTLSALKIRVQWHENIVTSGDNLGCSGWPCLTMCSSMPFAIHTALLNHLHCRWTKKVSSAKLTGTNFEFIRVSNFLGRQLTKANELYLPKPLPWSRRAKGVLALAQGAHPG